MAAVLLLVVTVGIGLPALLVGLLSTLGRLPRSPWLGLPGALHANSDDEWRAFHRAGGPVLLFGTVAVVVTGLAFAPFAGAGLVPGSVAIAVIAGQLLLTASSAFTADAVARASRGGGNPPAAG